MRIARLDIRPREVVAAVAVAAFQAGATTAASHGQGDRRGLDALAYALLIAGPLLLVLWRAATVPTLAAITGITSAYVALDYAYGPFVVAFALAVVGAVVRGHRAPAVAAALVLYAVAMLADDDGPTLPAIVAVAAWLLIVLGVGELVRTRLERRREAEQARAEEARRRAGEERLRIARDLHDVLAHSLSLINVQAGVALHLIDERPEQARTALADITRVSREALGEVRGTLAALRNPGDDAPRAPGPGLAGLDEMLERVRAAGLRVSARTQGRQRPLPAGVDQAAFRIVQEALTNVRRHGGGAAAAVSISYEDEELTVRIDDDGPGPAPGATGGSGIVGMRERAAALGGRLEAGPGPDGGFRVEARLPIGGAT
ncbi:MAG: sensor histidine kinase [Thermoleophilia bacterium]